MKKIILFSSIFLVGCDIPEPDYIKSTEKTVETKNYVHEDLGKFMLEKHNLFIWIDPSTGCKYYVYDGVQRGSLSIRYTKEGKPDCSVQNLEELD